MVRCRIGFVVLASGLIWMVAPAGAQEGKPARVEVITGHHGRTPPLWSYVRQMHAKPNAPFRVIPLFKPLRGKPGGGTWTDPDLENGTSGPLQAKAGVAFEGATADGYVPPDPNISVSPDTDAHPHGQIVETTNVTYAVYDKTGKTLLAPTAMHTIWAGGLPSSDLCATTDGGDPIVLWDQVDQKWIISQLAYNSSFSSNEWCMAVSTTSDALGSYDVYSYAFGSSFPDYPKVAVWQESSGTYSGIYFSANIFSHGNSFAGADFCGLPLANSGYSLDKMTCIQDSSAASVLPADLEGTRPAPSGSPEMYLDFSGSNTLELYRFSFDAAAEANTSLSAPEDLTVGTFHEACGGGVCVPQKGTKEQLDSLGDRLMYRLSYRNYGNGNDDLLVNQSAQVSSASNQTGVRWYEIANPTTNPTIAQQSTYSPDTSLYRWMGSIAQDHAGDLGLGFSTSSSSAYPGLAFTGQQASDSANTMEAEMPIYVGGGAQTKANRWGDYSSVSIDPTDDCTFWYVNEYLLKNGTYTNWATYIASFKFSTCR